MSQDDPYYCSFNQPAADETGLTEEAPIVQYRDGEGYISYSFHMVNAVSRMKMQKDGDGNGVAHPLSFGSGAYAGSETHLQYIPVSYTHLDVYKRQGRSVGGTSTSIVPSSVPQVTTAVLPVEVMQVSLI